MIAKIERRRFTVDEYHRMSHAGILTEADRVELIDGEIVQVTSITRRHAVCVAQITRRLTQALVDRCLVWPQNPIHLPRDSEPQPDVTILRLPADRYLHQPPRAEDVLWLIEVADVSYPYDRHVKLPVYSRAGISEAWLIDLTHEVVEIHREPSSRGFGSVQTMDRGSVLRSMSFDNVAVAVADLFSQR